MKKQKLLGLINEQNNLINSIAFLESEYDMLNFQIKLVLLKELEFCQNQIKLLEKSKLNTNERVFL